MSTLLDSTGLVQGSFPASTFPGLTTNGSGCDHATQLDTPSADPQPTVHEAANALLNVDQQKTVTAQLIDFNLLLPDGTIASLHQLLATISRAAGAELYATIQDNGRWILSSSRPQHHRGESLSKVMVSALEEAAGQTSGCLIAVEDRQSSMLLQAVRQELQAERVLSFDVQGKSVKVGLLVASKNATSSSSVEELGAFIKQARNELASWFEVWYLCMQGSKSHVWSARFRRMYQSRKTWMLALFLTIGSLAMPVPYRPQRECLVEPQSRRFLTSPINGRIVEAQVRPGDLVEANQLLARIDDENIRWELANAQADYQKACKKRDTALATRSGGDLRMAQLESEQFAIQIESLQSKLEQLEIRSPISGVVVEGDWVPTSGAAIERSQTLFEIAPLDSMRIRTLLSTEDLGQITCGTAVTIRVDSAYGKKWTGSIERIDPRGRVEGAEVVFEAESIIPNQEQALRPGMRGSVRLASGWHSLGWMIFHRPYLWLMKKLAW